MKKIFLLLSIIFTYIAVSAQNDQYNAACAASRGGNSDLAFNILKRIIGVSYFNFDHLINDPDFNSLHKDKRWQPLIKKIQQVKLLNLKPDQLYTDFDLTVSALKEAHTGLYWYNTRPQFDSICNA